MAHPTNKNIRKPWSPQPRLHVGFEALNHSFTFGMSPHRLLEPTGFLPPFPLETFNLSPAHKPLLPRKQNSASSFPSASPNSHQHREEGRTSPNHELSYNRFPLANKQKNICTLSHSSLPPAAETIHPEFLSEHRGSTQLLLLQSTVHSLWLAACVGTEGGGVWVVGAGCGWRNVEKVKSCPQTAEGYTSNFIDCFLWLWKCLV